VDECKHLPVVEVDVVDDQGAAGEGDGGVYLLPVRVEHALVVAAQLEFESET
jgi:hypothetical protein